MAFVKLDTGILDSTLWVCRDPREVFITALLMALPHEVVEPIPQYRVSSIEDTGFFVPPGWYGFVAASGPGIVRRAGLPQDLGMDALHTLGEPDPESRSSEFEGRRLVRVDGGYIVLNYMKYRDKDNTAAVRAQRYRDRKKQNRVTAVTRDSSCGVTIAEAEAEAEEEAVNLKSTPSVEISSVSDDSQINEKQIDSLPPCPQREILNLFCQTLPTLRKPRIWDGARAEALRSRWRYCAKGNGAFSGYSTQAEGLAFWKRYFEYIAKSRKLTEGIARPDGSIWKPDLPWLLKAENFSKVIERKFHD